APATVWGPPGTPPPGPASPTAPGSPAAPGSPPAARRRRALWITVAAVLALAGVGVGAALWFTRDRYPGLEFQNLAEVERVPAGEDRPTETLTALLGDAGYAAYPLPDDRLEIVAVDAGTGRTRWRKQTTQAAQQWEALVAVPGAVAALSDPIGVDAPRELVVRDAASGEQRWSRSIGDDDRVIFGRDVAVLVDTAGNRLVGLRMRDGNQVWAQDNPRDSSGNARSAVLPVETAEAAGGPAYPDGTPRDPWRGRADRLVQIGADRSARLLDLAEGTVLRSWPAVADLDDQMVARDDRLYVVDDAGVGGYRLLGYDLTRVAEPTVLHSAADDGRRVAALVACGKHRACLLEAPAGDADRAEVVAVAEGERAKRWATPGARELVPVGAHLIVRRQFPEATSTLFDPAGRAVLRDRGGVAVRLDAGNVLIFADPLSGGEADRSLAGLAVDGTGPVELGLAEDVRSESCSWNTSVLLCGAAKDFVLYRFAPTP
ncbi:PQQ-binding-like beta-propeller repeat protein, partial [Micromonospora carbonacea]|uniref:outer membrane protein assembly factor BamB family protein n=1 Tax=Micromonospora carbonacea TaxID=47853 RepID=UPI0033EF3A98